MRSRPLVAAAVFAVVFGTAPMSSAAGPQDVANSISEQVMSPFCPGVTLHDCPSDNAIALRAQIAKWASRGWSRQKIMDKLTAEYSDISAVPPERGADLLVWLLPAIALLAGGATAAMFARRWSRRDTDTAGTADLGPRDRRRLEEELAAVRNEL
jgi:cytochrome c-type biogenesis protein CcmH/NrfF